MPAIPTATVFIFNDNGEQHLRACLPTVDAVDYPRVSVTVLDSGSRDGSVGYVRTHHPRVRVVTLDRIRGPVAAYNAAIRDATSDLVAILDNDTRVERLWLQELVSALERHSAVAVSSAILDWDGTDVGPAGPIPTFLGHPWPLDRKAPVAARDEAEGPVLFASSSAMLVRRDVFLAAGGFDEDYFACLEDVDLGWRLNLFGGRIVSAPKAVTYRGSIGRGSESGDPLRLRLRERNALATVYKNYGDEALRRILPVAVALTLARGLRHPLPERASLTFANAAPKAGHVSAATISTLIALEEFALRLPSLTEKRRAIQSRRTVDDEQILALFPDAPKLYPLSDEYDELAKRLIQDFRISELFGLTSHSRTVTVPAPALDPEVTVARDAGLVSVIVLTAGGPRHLPECLDALRAHTWAADRTEVIVVDNGSAEDPRGVVERHYAGAKVLRTSHNLGFAGGNNAGARAANGGWLVFLNDDTRVAPDWLERLIAVAERRRAASVGALIVDWAGTRIDFCNGSVNLEGRGFSVGHGVPVSRCRLAEGPLLFPCGAAVLFRRDVFDAIGGWDEGTFAYYEDVEIGWRLWLLGHEVWFAPDAVVHHRHHGTSGEANPARQRALDRNALRMLYTHLEEATLQWVLPAALVLAADRALLSTPFSRASDSQSPYGRLSARVKPRVLKKRLLQALNRRGARRELGVITNLRTVGVAGVTSSAAQVGRELASHWQHRHARDRFLIERALADDVRPEREIVPIQTVATLAGIVDLLAALPELSEKRAWLQAHRCRSDADILQMFGLNWRSPVPTAEQDLHDALRESVLQVLDPPRDDLGDGPR